MEKFSAFVCVVGIVLFTAIVVSDLTKRRCKKCDCCRKRRDEDG